MKKQKIDHKAQVPQKSSCRVIYCVSIVYAYPNYKRPWADHGVWHYKTLEEAEAKERKEKAKFYKKINYELSKDGENYVRCDEDDGVVINEEQLHEKYFRLHAAYMDMLPFDSSIETIEIEKL